MSFIWPRMLLSLVWIPLCVGAYIRMQRRRQRRLARVGSFGLVRGATGHSPGMRRHIPPALWMAGLAILLAALARPQAVIRLPRIEGDIILAFDVSGSMAADDLDPTRLEAAKAAARAFVEQSPPSARIGVVAFSDSGFTVQAPTNDQEAILVTISRLAPESGTSLANGILASLNTIVAADAEPPPGLYTNRAPSPTPTPTPVPAGTYTSAVIVLLTDGENNESPDPLDAAQAAANRGVRIYTVGIGSAAGTTLDLDGFSVHTRLDEGMLRQLSEITGGTYYSADNEGELRTIYGTLDPQLAIVPEQIEVTSIFAGASILVLLIGGTLSLLWFGRVP
jgi:Ca-activated chloride channel family protein